MNVIMPDDRSCKQPSTGFCTNPLCREIGADFHFQFEIHHAHVVCPKCGADRDPWVGILVLIHALILSDKGPIRGSWGRCYEIACDDKRAYLATATNLEAVTDNPGSANCKGCLDRLAKLKMTEPVGIGI